jgi:hypothetical protein
MGVLAALALTACRVLDEDHCANLAGDATCRDRGGGLDHCDRCEAANDGCVAAPSSDPACAVDESTSDVSAADEQASAPMDDDGDDGEAPADTDASGDATTSTSAPTTSAPTTSGGDEASSTAAIGSTESTTSSVGPECGNGVIDADEQCDGEDFGGLDCAALPEHGGGELACDGACMLDTSACTACLVATAPCRSDAQCCNESCTGLGVCL